METSVRVIVTGATGMVGEGVLQECLQNPAVKAVLVIGRKPCGVIHAKLKEIIHPDFFDLTAIAPQLGGYNACYFCLGVSSIGLGEAEYHRLTYTLTMHVAEILSGQNKDMTFCYVSGAGTDSTEKGRQMWARVKGKTENDLAGLPFAAEFNFRPGFMLASPGAKNLQAFYKYIAWMYPLFRKFFPSMVCTLAEVGKAMIAVTQFGYPKQILEVKDIVDASKIA